MAMLPIMFDLDRYHRHNSLNDFGLVINPLELTTMLALPSELRQLQQRAREIQQKKAGNQSLAPTTGKDGFQVCMDVQQFSPSEITVKTLDNYVVIEGKHEERQDEHGFVSRNFTRRYHLPKGFDPKTVVSTLSSDSVLTIKAPPPQALESNERVISIQQTGPARLNVKENKAVDEEKAEKVENGDAK